MHKAASNLYIGVVHYSPLVARKQNLQYLKVPFPALEWITENDIPSMEESEIKFVDEINLMSEFDFASGLRLNSFSQKYPRQLSSLIVKILRIGSLFSKRAKISILGALPKKRPLPKNWNEVSLMHMEALKRGLVAGKKWILVLEDDAIIQENFLDSLEKLVELPSDEEIWINLNDGVGPNLFKHKSDQVLNFGGFYKVIPPMTRCTVAYLVNQNLARIIIDEFKETGIPNWVPIDFALDAILKKFKVKCLWQDPACVLQGSSNGKYISNLQQFRLA